MLTLRAFVISHWPMFLFVFGYPVITALLSWWLWWDTDAHWEAYKMAHPNRALAVKILRYLSPHMRGAIKAWRDEAARRSFAPSLDALPPAPPPSVPPVA